MAHSELSIANRLDRLPVGRFHYRLIFMIGAGLFPNDRLLGSSIHRSACDED